MSLGKWLLAVVIAGCAVVGSARSGLAASPVEDVEQRFAQVDRDGDGKISATEAGEQWMRYDFNEDGVLSRAEFITGRNGDRTRAFSAGRTERAWQLLDWNHDDYLSGTELDGKWEMYDADNNGRVTHAEFMGEAPMPVNPPKYVPPPMQNNPPPYVPPPKSDNDAPEKAASLWNKTINEAKRSDLFTTFSLVQTKEPALQEGGLYKVEFRPSQEALSPSFALELFTDADQKIRSGVVVMPRALVDNPQTGVYCRRLAASVIYNLADSVDQPKLKDLLIEIFYGDGSDPNAPALPNPPTLGYQAFLGKIKDFTRDMEAVRLEILNAGDNGDTLIIGIEETNNKA